jgi:hypothetical protein
MILLGVRVAFAERVVHMGQRRVLAWSLCLLLVANAAAAQASSGSWDRQRVRPFEQQIQNGRDAVSRYVFRAGVLNSRDVVIGRSGRAR